MLKHKEQMDNSEETGVHGGVGMVKITKVLDKQDKCKGISFLHDDILPPGSSIGEHVHERKPEIYYCASGRGKLILDGEEMEMRQGDISVCGKGHSHGLVNDSGEALRLIVIRPK